ncbi:unnamed protein product [Protopolystoma xenopodis]|uniref:Uncharacterized protein n=1 Tax=Protopolystoma xenopodis TaxID=117903 RepID=A0A448X7F6_9PLAT|nr:unnamed protein product [Protopolystoma xenopodis]
MAYLSPAASILDFEVFITGLPGLGPPTVSRKHCYSFGLSWRVLCPKMTSLMPS